MDWHHSFLIRLSSRLASQVDLQVPLGNLRHKREVTVYSNFYVTASR